MQKPDDIPEDIWAESYEVMYLSRDDEHLRQNIARAILAERERIRHYAKSALNGFDTLDPETALENAKSDLHSIILHMGY